VIDRKKKIKYIQYALFLSGIIVIIFSYSNFEKNEEKIIPLEQQKLIKKKLDNKNKGDVFFNVEYSGLDLSGNRFVLKSKEASTDRENQELIELKEVEADFYFKDDTVLKVYSDFGKYNNRSLDILFRKNVKALYEGSELLAEEANFSNSNNNLTISKNVEVKDKMGILKADKLTFDIKLKTLTIKTFEENKINANLNIK
tara:strand:- start:474 stop:1073 length:600 start_codon:yes stop_codon:yes gene_type:complete